MEEEKLNIISTNYAKEHEAVVWKFSIQETFVLIGFCIAGLVAFVAMFQMFEWPFKTSLMLASMIPTVGVLILVKLIVDKPMFYSLHFCEWHIARKFRKGQLTNIKPIFFNSNEYRNN